MCWEQNTGIVNFCPQRACTLTKIQWVTLGSDGKEKYSDEMSGRTGIVRSAGGTGRGR